MMDSRKRSGFTLLEVILALAILAGAAAVLSQMAWSGLENARLAGDRITAQLLAESLMAELDAGIHALESVADQPIEDLSTDWQEVLAANDDLGRWLATIDVSTASVEGMLHVAVTVRDGTSIGRAAEAALVRWRIDPSEDAANE